MRSLRIAAVGALVALGATGCSSGHHLQTTGTSGASTTASTRIGRGSGRQYPETNKQRTEIEVRSLLDLVKVPAGSVRTALEPAVIRWGPTIGTPEGTSLIDDHRFWKVPMSMTAVLAWFSHHAPGGLKETGSGSSAQGNVATSSGLGYAGPTSLAWADAQIAISIAPDGSDTSVVRGDGEALWVDPSPVRVPAGGHRIRLLATGSCPKSDDGVTDVTNSAPGMEKALLPGGSPDRGLICEYYGGNGRPFQLKKALSLGPAAASAFAARVRSLPLGHVDNEIINCPMDDGMADVAALDYPDGRTADLWMATDGCQTVSNGYILASGSVSL